LWPASALLPAPAGGAATGSAPCSLLRAPASDAARAASAAGGGRPCSVRITLAVAVPLGKRSCSRMMVW
jgi:hypothetical protein